MSPGLSLKRALRCCGLIAALALGLFSVSAMAQVTSNVHIEGPFATEFSSSINATASTSTYVNAGRQMSTSGPGGELIRTTYVNYQVCVTTLSTNTTICEVGSGRIADSELTGDVNSGLGTPPKELSVNFNSAAEPGYTVLTTECDNGGNCYPVTPSGGTISVSWRKNGEDSRTVIGSEEDRYGSTIMTKSKGKSVFFSSDSSGTIDGTTITGVHLSQVGSADGLSLEVVIGSK